MPLWACGHEGEEGHSRLCPHLAGADLEESSYHRVLQGHGLEYDMCCPACASGIKSGEAVSWSSVCRECIETLDENEWDALEWIGVAGIEEQHLVFDTTLIQTVLDTQIASFRAVAPLHPTCFVGYRDGALLLVDDKGATTVCAAPLPSEKDEVWYGRHLTPRLHVSADERFVALVNDYGRYGLVFDLRAKRVSMTLDKGSYRNEHAPFPAIFFVYKGRSLLVHGTQWNRLDISDPETGTLLTTRQFSPSVEEQRTPQHYLGFLHGQLYVSEDSRWIADDQWCWGPAGEVATWDLVRWMEENVWKSEDGETRQRLCQRIYLWNIPVAWVDAKQVAFWGIGYDDEIMLDGARVFDVITGAETATFAGPGKTAFFGGEGRLFSVEEDGLHIWDAATGARQGRIADFKPRWQRGDFLIELDKNRVRSWNWCMAFREK